MNGGYQLIDLTSIDIPYTGEEVSIDNKDIIRQIENTKSKLAYVKIKVASAIATTILVSRADSTHLSGTLPGTGMISIGKYDNTERYYARFTAE